MQKTVNAASAAHEANQTAQTFYGLGIAPKILEILERIKFKAPTPIQFKAIPLATEGKDVIGIAQTGTGKTHAFAIPMVQRLAQRKGVGLVLAPTRELAIQIDEAFQGIVRSFSMHTACLIGGAPMPPQIQALRRNPRVIIATPGRLLDHMGQWNVIPNDITMLVLDEADTGEVPADITTECPAPLGFGRGGESFWVWWLVWHGFSPLRLFVGYGVIPVRRLLPYKCVGLHRERPR